MLARLAEQRAFAACVVALVMASCSGEPEPPNGTATTVRAPCAGGTSATQAPIDTGITPIKGAATFNTASAVRVAIALEESSLAQARLAESRAVASEVKAYAKAVIEERAMHLARLEAIGERAKTLREDPTPFLLRKEMERTRVELEVLERMAFDLPFMTAEITTEARMLGLIDAALLPSASQAMVTPGADGTERALDRELRELRSIHADRIVHALRVQGVLRAAEASIGGASELGGDARGPAIPQ